MCVVNSKDSKQYLQHRETDGGVLQGPKTNRDHLMKDSLGRCQIKPCILILFGCTQYVKIINFKCSMSMFCITFSEY